MSANPSHAEMLLGIAVSSGVARGPAFVLANQGQVAVPRRSILPGEAEGELARFDAAVQEAQRNLLVLQDDVRKKVGEREAGIFDAHIGLLLDPALREEIVAHCLKDKINVEAALADAIEKFSQMFSKIGDAYFRERASDVRDVGQRVLDILLQRQATGGLDCPAGSIVVTGDLLPSMTARMNLKAVEGLVMERGGQTSHSAILARSLEIPCVIHAAGAVGKIKTNDPLLVDGLSGRVFISPSKAILREYDRLQADFKAHQGALKELIDLPSVTQDGTLVKLCANIGKAADAAAARLFNADGVGLYRTEFAFLVQDHFPTEEEQYRVYRLAAEQMKGRDITIRLLDIGSDKLLPYFPLPVEANPSLGQRGIRLLLKHPEILKTQLRAILRLSATHAVSILLPMVGGVEDLLETRNAIASVKTLLTAEHKEFNRQIPMGAMIETPAAAVLIRRLAREADFFSIGTNDLVQYLLTTDRMSAEVASYYEPLHPAVLQVLAAVVISAKSENKTISLCGEMAGNPAYTSLLLGLGFRSFSVTSGEILEIKKAIRSTAVSQTESLAKKVLDLGTIQEIKDCLR
jgi:phosphotransferase system enzyme I (PtsI)